jgi:hypothetical protein
MSYYLLAVAFYWIRFSSAGKSLESLISEDNVLCRLQPIAGVDVRDDDKYSEFGAISLHRGNNCVSIVKMKSSQLIIAEE